MQVHIKENRMIISAIRIKMITYDKKKIFEEVLDNTNTHAILLTNRYQALHVSP